MGELYKLDFANGKSYIGISVKSAKARFDNHKRCAKTGKSAAIYNAWRKHGEPNLTVLAILEDRELASTERRAIAVYGTLVPGGYNMTPGGEISPMLFPEIAAKVSASMLGKVWSEERKVLRSKMMIGNKNLLGHSHSEESRAKMSESRKGVKRSAESVEKMASKNRGLKRSEETVKKNSAAASKWMEERKKNDPQWWSDWCAARGLKIKAAKAAKKEKQ